MYNGTAESTMRIIFEAIVTIALLSISTNAVSIRILQVTQSIVS
jgi:hypothetical protein